MAPTIVNPIATPAPANTYEARLDPTDCWFCEDGSNGNGRGCWLGGRGILSTGWSWTTAGTRFFLGSRTMVRSAGLDRLAKDRRNIFLLCVVQVSQPANKKDWNCENMDQTNMVNNDGYEKGKRKFPIDSRKQSITFSPLMGRNWWRRQLNENYAEIWKLKTMMFLFFQQTSSESGRRFRATKFSNALNFVAFVLLRKRRNPMSLSR